MKKSETITKIASALLLAQKEMGNALKDSKNPFFKSVYADLNSVREACIPALNKHGITALQPIVYEDGKPFVETVLLHESGEYISSLTEIICDKANNAQSQGSGTTYSRRYGLQSICNIGTEDDDGNAASGNNNSSQQKEKSVSKPSPSKETKPLLERGTENWNKVVAALEAGKGTIDQVKSKYTVIEPIEELLLDIINKKP
jgi:hypothetical protein